VQLTSVQNYTVAHAGPAAQSRTQWSQVKVAEQNDIGALVFHHTQRVPVELRPLRDGDVPNSWKAQRREPSAAHELRWHYRHPHPVNGKLLLLIECLRVGTLCRQHRHLTG
jgi:hypothetical protein